MSSYEEIQCKVPELSTNYDLIIGNGFNLDHESGEEYSYDNIKKRANSKEYLEQFKSEGVYAIAQYVPFYNDLSEVIMEKAYGPKISYYLLQMLGTSFIDIDINKSIEQNKIVFDGKATEYLRKNAGQFKRLTFKLNDEIDYEGIYNLGKIMFKNLILLSDEKGHDYGKIHEEMPYLRKHDKKIKEGNFESVFAYFDMNLKVIHRVYKQLKTIHEKILVINILAKSLFLTRTLNYKVIASLLNIKDGKYTHNTPYAPKNG